MQIRGFLFALGGSLVLAAPVTAQSVNIDFGPPGTGPPDTYRAAGIPGAWNAFPAIDPAITYDLFGVDGQPTAATVSQFGGTEIVQAALDAPGDPQHGDRILLGDAMVTHTTIESCLFFHGLINGTYEVTTYAWMPTAPSTPNNVHVDTNPDFVLVGGPWPGAHEEEITFARHIVQVTDGFLGPHSGVPSGGDYQTGAALNGIQIRLMTIEPPLYISETRLEWLAALGAVRYDVVRGDLSLLHSSGGDFTAATDSCVGENVPDQSLTHTTDVPPPGEAYWYLVRGVAPGGNLTYDALGGSQVGSRDAEIDASPVSCN